MNEEEAIERCKQIIKDNNEIIKEARKNRDINSMQLTASLDNDSIAIETVLNLLEKKDRQLEERTNRIRNLEKECQSNFDNMMDTIQDNSKKDKIIDEMTYYLSNFDIDEMCEKCDRCIGNGCYADDDMEFKINCIKQYYERKIENGN